MRKMCWIALLLPCLAVAETSLWRISKDNHQLYLGGTIHTLGREDYPLPQAFDQAFNKTSVLVLETDLDAANNLEGQKLFTEHFLYKDGTTLKDHLAAKTYHTLQRYCRKSGLPIESLLPMKPVMAALFLTMYELKKLNMAETGVDNHYLQKSKEQRKKVLGLESLKDEITALEAIDNSLADEFILDTMNEMESLPIMMKDLKQAWRLGNIKNLEKIALIPMQKQFSHVYQKLLIERNNAWIPQIKNFMATTEKELILVGALHLVGQDGLLAILQKEGYKLEKM